jgi:tetratricopeptide (TPR) repeat protein
LRKAAYAYARLTWDRVSEVSEEANWERAMNNSKEVAVAPWREAIVELEDLLMLYDLNTFNSRFSEEDKGLYQTFQRDNAHLKFLLSRSFLKLGDAVAAADHARELLDNDKHYDLSIQKGNTEDTQLATVQKTEALLADALYDQGKFVEAMEHYRRAHDRYLDSAERPFYSLNIVDCLIGLERKAEAIQRLKQIKFEFEAYFREDEVVFKDRPEFNKEGWLAMVNDRIALLESSPVSAVGN